MRMCHIGMTLVLTLAASPLNAQTVDFTGTWVRQSPAAAAVEDLSPSWEQLTIIGARVTLIRAARPSSGEVYVTDDTERDVTRVAGQARRCRARWEQAALVIACVQTTSGPGTIAPPVVTREIRQLDAQGQLVVDLTWGNGADVVKRRAVLRRELP